MKNINYIIDKYANLITIRDPMFVIVGDTYYLTGTQPSYWKGINNGVHLWSTKDLKNYNYHGIILSRNDIFACAANGGQLFARIFCCFT